MAILKAKQVRALSRQDADKKLKELRLEMLKETKPGQGASIKTKEIKRTIARILTHLNAEKSNTVIKSKEAPKTASKKTNKK